MTAYGAGSATSPARQSRKVFWSRLVRFIRSSVRGFALDAPSAKRSINQRLFPVDARRVGPQLFQRVILARVGVEDVNDHVAVILNDPLAGLVALDGDTPV